MESQRKTAVVCAYCRFDDDCDAESILRGFVHQFLAQNPLLLPLVDRYYKKHKIQRTSPKMEEIVEMLHSLITSLDSAYIVVDGLDEISGDKEKANLLQALGKLPARTLIFSRPLELHLRDLPSATIFSVEARDEDIEKFVGSILLNNASFQETIGGVEGNLVRDIAVKIRKRSRGM